MNKYTFLLLILFLLIHFFSCEDKDRSVKDNSIQTIVPPDTSFLVKSEIVDESYRCDYTYNSKSQLSEWNVQYPTFSSSTHFIYGPDGKLIIREYKEKTYSEFSHKTYFSYDKSGRLIAYDNIKLHHSDSIIEVSGILNGKKLNGLMLKTDSIGRIVRLIDKNTNTLFRYDSVGNITFIASYLNKGRLKNEYRIQYDEKPDPFFGMLKSIYIERFLNSFYPVEDVFIGSIEGYRFPYFKNNILSVSEKKSKPIQFSYTYNEKNLPVFAEEVDSRDTFRYEIKYQTALSEIRRGN